MVAANHKVVSRLFSRASTSIRLLQRHHGANRQRNTFWCKEKTASTVLLKRALNLGHAAESPSHLHCEDDGLFAHKHKVLAAELEAI